MDENDGYLDEANAEEEPDLEDLMSDDDSFDGFDGIDGADTGGIDMDDFAIGDDGDIEE